MNMGSVIRLLSILYGIFVCLTPRVASELLTDELNAAVSEYAKVSSLPQIEATVVFDTLREVLVVLAITGSLWSSLSLATTGRSFTACVINHNIKGAVAMLSAAVQMKGDSAERAEAPKHALANMPPGPESPNSIWMDVWMDCEDAPPGFNKTPPLGAKPATAVKTKLQVVAIAKGPQEGQGFVARRKFRRDLGKNTKAEVEWKVVETKAEVEWKVVEKRKKTSKIRPFHKTR